jgi:low temperature requirement protein LtrA
LLLPVGLCLLSFFAAGGIFMGMSVAFRDKAGTTSRAIFAIWWVVMFFEGIVIITISCKWRMLSFKATHLVERMGLLTLIVIGEGAIGVTKTVAKVLGKGTTFEGAALIISIVLLLVSLDSLFRSIFPLSNSYVSSSYGCFTSIISPRHDMARFDSRYGLYYTFLFISLSWEP